MDAFDRNKQWASRWGKPMDPKSCPIVRMTKAQIEEIRSARVTLPVGCFTIGGLNQSVRDAMSDAWRFINAVEHNTLDQLDKVIAEEAVVLAQKRKDLEEGKSTIIETKVDEPEVNIADASFDEGEDCEIDKCKHCGSERFAVETRKSLCELVCLNSECETHKID